MKKKIVLWGTDNEEKKILIALELLAQENKVNLITFPEEIATESLYNLMMDKWRKNEAIELVRIVNGQSIKLTVNLTDLASLPEKNIILQPDDIIHIGATKAKSNDRNLGKISLITSIVTGVAVIASVFVK